ncbi:hypothetical protein [Hyphomicrobium sp. CS1GBMeth3]|uniref:hypothetical protein n=1 Tax=Hyphomicrobium sp. CS1GBMeth3 TaxID=1892845 RepID=UPI000B026A65|nr:hypothetical protein [Hyphomicrobium sp. CS1GBMeth3]
MSGIDTKAIDGKLISICREAADLARERLPEYFLAYCESPIEQLFHEGASS